MRRVAYTALGEVTFLPGMLQLSAVFFPVEAPQMCSKIFQSSGKE